MPETKECSRCHISKPLSEFRARSNGVFKRQAYCKECQRQTWREYNTRRRQVDPEYLAKRRQTIRKCARKIAQRPEYKTYDVLRVNHRRALKKKTGGKISLLEWKTLCAHYGNVCLACGVHASLTMDHIIPLSMGGRNEITNVQPLCRSCNSIKYDKHIDYRPDKGAFALSLIS